MPLDLDLRGAFLTALAAVAVTLTGTSCKPRSASSELSAEIASSESRLKRLYHFGAAGDLMAYGDRKSSGIGEGEWAQIKSNSNQLAYRRGFYVAVNPGYSDQYALQHLFSPDLSVMPWLIQVILRDECLAPGAVVRNVREIEDDEAFAAWFVRTQSSTRLRNYTPTTFSQHCQLPIDQIGSKVVQENECTTLYDQFYADPSVSVGLIQDHWWNIRLDFWVIRRRGCIEAVRASPESVLAFASDPEVWRALPDGQMGRRGSAEGMQAVVLAALARLPGGSVDSIAAVDAAASASDLEAVKTRLPQVLDVAASCLKAGKQTELMQSLAVFFREVKSHSDVPENLQADRFASFFENFVRTKVPSLKALCHGEEGGQSDPNRGASDPNASGRWYRVRLETSKSPASILRPAFLTVAGGKFSCRTESDHPDEVQCFVPAGRSPEDLRELLPEYVKELVPI